MPIPRRPAPDPTYDSGRRDLVVNGYEVSAALTKLSRDDVGRRMGATHIITITPAVNAASGTVVAIDGVLWRVVGSRAHPILKSFRVLLVVNQQG